VLDRVASVPHVAPIARRSRLVSSARANIQHGGSSLFCSDDWRYTEPRCLSPDWTLLMLAVVSIAPVKNLAG
jgi:hypothetical protein